MDRKDSRSTLKRVLLLPWRQKLRLPFRLLTDSRVPLLAKLIVPGLLLYLAMPFDLIPDFIPVLGQLDDLLVAALALGLFVRLCPVVIVEEHLGALETTVRTQQ